MHRSSSIVSLVCFASGLFACADPDGAGEMTEEVAALIVPPSDPSPPQALVLGLAEAATGGGSATVYQGGSGASFALRQKTGNLNILAMAADAESGIQALEVWCNRAVTTCQGTTCSVQGPGLVSAPCFASSSPGVPPGQSAAEISILLDTQDLATQIPQASLGPGQSRAVRLTFWAVARNHFGLASTTSFLSADWSETYVPPPPTCVQACVSRCRQSCPSGREHPACLAECRSECRESCEGP